MARKIQPSEPELLPVIEPIKVIPSRCGGCAYFHNKKDTSNPFDGYCHGLPPQPANTSAGFIWARTRSNEDGCSLFKPRG